jgi:hypothetical protein
MVIEVIKQNKVVQVVKDGTILESSLDANFNKNIALVDSDDISEGSTNKYYTDEKVDDRVNSLLVAGDNITLTYDDTANTLTIDAETGGGGGSSAIKIYNTVVSETTSLTDLVSHTIPANTLGLTGQCRIKCQGYLYNGSGSTTNATVYIIWGGSTIFFDTTATFTSDTSDPYGMELDLIISNINDVDKQYIQGRFDLSNNTDANQGRGDLTTDDTKIQCVWGGETLAGSPLRDQFVYADTTSDQTIQIQVAPSLSDANYQWVAAVTTIEYL